MSNYGFKAGNILNVDLYNGIIDTFNFHKKANFILSTKVLTTNGGLNTDNVFSFYQSRPFLTLITVYMSETEITTHTYPSRSNTVDSSGSAVAYTHVSDSVESFSTSILGTSYYIYVLKAKYSTAHIGDVWFTASVAGTSFTSKPLTQFLVAQHYDSVTTIPKIERETVSNYANWEEVKNWMNNQDKISYALDVFNTSGESLTPINTLGTTFFTNFRDYWYLINMEGFLSSSIFRFTRRVQESATFTTFAEGVKFTNVIINKEFLESGGSLQKLLYAKHCTLPIQRFITGALSINSSLSSVDLYFMKTVAEAYQQYRFCGEVVGQSDFDDQTVSVNLIPIVSGTNFFTLGSNIEIHFKLKELI